MPAAAEEFEEFDDLPEFANEPNRALHRQLKEHEKAVVVVENELVETKERIGTMEEHLSESIGKKCASSHCNCFE